MAQLLNVFTITLLFYSLHQVASDHDTYYIKANSTDVCTQSCLTLSQFVSNSNESGLLDSNITLVFSPGMHYLDTILIVSNISDFSMISENFTAQIRCNRSSDSRIRFIHSQNVHMTNLEFIGCGVYSGYVDKFVVSDTTFRGQENSGTAFTLNLVETTGQMINCAFLSLYWSRRVRLSSVIFATHSSINISKSNFENNGARFFFNFYGGILLTDHQSIVHINASTFIRNRAVTGLYSNNSSITIEASIFYNNVHLGALLISNSSNTTIEQSVFLGSVGFGNLFFSNSNRFIIKMSEFYHNFGITSRGALLHSRNNSVTIEESKFHCNTGIILGFRNSNSTIDVSEFKQNTGAVVLSTNSKVVITTSEFDNNTETGSSLFYQGMILGSYEGTILLNNTNFTNNKAPVLVALSSIIEHHNSLIIVNNSAENGLAIIHLYNSEFIGHYSGNTTVSNNTRSLVVFTSNITFMGNVQFSNNQQPQNTTALQEGGAITLIQSNIFLDGTCRLEHNHAKNGGAIFSIGSKLYVKGDVTVAHNTASRNGGGVYFIESELQCLNKSTFILLNNSATYKGGGLHASNSFIKVISVLKATQVDTAKLNFTNNIAERGGGLSLEANARIIILKYEYGDIVFGSTFTYEQSYAIIFLTNSADYGGAVYVDDDTVSVTCTSDPKTECFFQVLAYIHGLYSLESIPDSILNYTRQNLKTQSVYFSENGATISGSTLYGGLLDRCAVSQFAEVGIKYEEDYKLGGNGITYLKHVSTITDMSISSRPVQVCLCSDNEHNCTHQSHFEVKKGETFNVTLASIDEIGQPVNGLIHASFKFARSAVASGQATREIPAQCTNLTFNVVCYRWSMQGCESL